MKTKLLLSFLLCLFFSPVLIAQNLELWGTTTMGGVNGDGTIFKADASGSNLQAVYSFIDSLGADPVGKLLYASTGEFYGVTELGGFGDSCVICKYNPSTGAYTKIYDLFLNTQFGWGAHSGMMQASNGMLYGLCAEGGANQFGVIYKIDPANDSYTDIYDFDQSLGTYPSGSLVQASNGLLYGYTLEGGSNNLGVIFSFDPVNNAYTKLEDFHGLSNGKNPMYGALIQASNGMLYGMTQGGGVFGQGVIFSYDIATDVCTKIYDFDGFTGAAPFSGLIQASNGLLYGMTNLGGVNNLGAIFSFDINTNVESVLLDFDGLNGQWPSRGLTEGGAGKLFGTTANGGSLQNGVAFSFDIATSTYSKLIDFDPAFSKPDCEFTLAPTGASGVPVIQGNSTIAVFPNPASELLNITGVRPGETIRFNDLTGREIQTSQVSNAGNLKLDISLFPEVFFFRTENGSTKKVVRIK